MNLTVDQNYHKIGKVAKVLGISVPTLRMYEREGILIPVKSGGGTRYFNDEDIVWVHCIRRMINELGLNIEGIRRLLALIPCWDLTQCANYKSGACRAKMDSNRPCWMKTDVPCRTGAEDCHACPAYRYSVNCENLKALFQIRLKALEHNHYGKHSQSC